MRASGAIQPQIDGLPNAMRRLVRHRNLPAFAGGRWLRLCNLVESAARDAGFLVNAAAPDVIRLAPPLVITEAQIEEFLTALPGVLDKAVTP